MIRHRAAFQAWAASLALVAAATPLLATLHFTSVAHITCAEDGELIESRQVDHTGDLAHEDGANGAVLPERHEVPLGAAGSGHDHCVLALHARSGSRAPPGRNFVPCAPAGEQVRNTAPESAQLRAQAVYRLAPKADPPRAA